MSWRIVQLQFLVDSATCYLLMFGGWRSLYVVSGALIGSGGIVCSLEDFPRSSSFLRPLGRGRTCPPRSLDRVGAQLGLLACLCFSLCSLGDFQKILFLLAAPWPGKDVPATVP